jgi:16S rRNA (guanine(966)-N(2))-methyltransferase RsmD
MRIISGFLGGRLIDAPKGHRTHPMSEKMRGAIFGALGDISGLSLLDPFSGSGALAIEAVSRGANPVVAIEVDKGAHTVISQNIKKLGIAGQIKAIRAYASAWSTRHQAQLFDIILADPPYDKMPYKDLVRLPRHLKAEGIFVLSWPGKAEPLKLETLTIIQIKDYSDSQLVFYRKQS